MANKNLGIILLSGVLTLGTASFALPQSGQGNTNDKSQENMSTSQEQSTTQSSSETTNQTSSKKIKSNAKNSGSQSNNNVRQVQTALQQKGFDPGPIDGVMGRKTQKAISDFQRQQSLTASGRLDAQTKSALGLNGNQQTGFDSQEPGREKPGDVTPTQKSVPDQQYNQIPDQNLDQTPDQNLNQTPDQRQKPDPDQPQVNPDQQYQNQQTPAVRPDIGRQDSSGSNMGIGTASSLENVRQAQMALKNRGFDPGEINGMLSSETQDAIRKFQSSNNLPVTGNLDDRTQSALGVSVKGTTNPDTFHNEGRTKPPQDNNDPSSMGPSAQAVTQQAEARTTVADPPAAAHKHMDNDVNENGKALHEYRERAYKAGEVVDSLTAAGDNTIPQSILNKAEAIAVIPGMIKGAFGIGGRYGKGLVAERLPDGTWGAPAYIAIGGGSFGAQIGVNSTDLVLVFTDKHALNSLEKGFSLKLGVDAGVSAGPVGRNAEAGVSENVKGGIFAYSHSKGLFAGVALDGAVIDYDKSANRKVYGSKMAADKIMTSSTMVSNASVQPFMQALDKAVPARRATERRI